jgi:hypothetical protein
VGGVHREIIYYVSRDQGNMLSYTLWPVFRFTLGGGGDRYFCRFYLEVFNAILIARTATDKERIKNN